MPSLPSFEWDFLVIDTPQRKELILGFDFLNHFNPSTYWRLGTISFKNHYKASNYSLIPLINDFYTVTTSAALIKNFGEDNSIASRHLFHGNVKLPPSSYHHSLGEWWDQEEVETVIKVVPPAYHHYFDLFSKVKAEKPCPHCSCDHQIELEGSLPPVGKIYSLSNQESDTLRDNISGNLEKCFLQPSFSSTGAPVLFVKRWMVAFFCVYYCKLNFVTTKNKSPVPPMNHLLNFLDGSSIFYKIYLCGSYILLRIKEGD
ncbi:hypothetical protein O181_004320 [Austropuccinia psidii MF-1]|uniref:Uncharacterized protein n=1 Tax=Austropuccinia psidii MF-1 TaxID=1389203 RepID=A0A9Q3GER4_9BASI|nr:hypothetical protein [Austropuccinia psidii MF-1]